jgi:hypothetical protein
VESYIDKLGHDFNRNKAPRHHHPFDPKALKLRLRTSGDVAPVQLTALSVSDRQGALPSVAASDRHCFRSRLPRACDEQPN